MAPYAGETIAGSPRRLSTDQFYGSRSLSPECTISAEHKECHFVAMSGLFHPRPEHPKVIGILAEHLLDTGRNTGDKEKS